MIPQFFLIRNFYQAKAEIAAVLDSLQSGNRIILQRRPRPRKDLKIRANPAHGVANFLKESQRFPAVLCLIFIPMLQFPY